MDISVIIPMFNSEKTIVSALDSVLNQTYRGRVEVIVINDGSTDHSQQIVEEYIKKCTSTIMAFKLINKSNSGVSSARNIGIKVAGGEWIALLDSDDIWLPEKLEKQMVEISKNLDIKFIGSNRNNEIYPFFNKSKEKIFTLTAKQILTKWYPQTSTVLISSKILKENLFDVKRSHGEDGDLWLRILYDNNLYVLNESLVYTGGGKRPFGMSGLSADLSKMFSGELLNLNDALKRKQINSLEFLFYYFYFHLKYFRRIIISRFFLNVSSKLKPRC